MVRNKSSQSPVPISPPARIWAGPARISRIGSGNRILPDCKALRDSTECSPLIPFTAVCRGHAFHRRVWACLLLAGRVEAHQGLPLALSDRELGDPERLFDGHRVDGTFVGTATFRAHLERSRWNLNHVDERISDGNGNLQKSLAVSGSGWQTAFPSHWGTGNRDGQWQSILAQKPSADQEC